MNHPMPTNRVVARAVARRFPAYAAFGFSFAFAAAMVFGLIG